MTRGTTVTNYLVSGDPEGIIFSYMSNWTGQAIKIPRNLFNEAKHFNELQKPGIYFLIGQSQDNPDDKIIYVGEANNLMERLVTHLRDPDKSFCEVIVCFCSKDENLTVSHTKYLEGKIIDHLNSIHEYRMKNGKAGDTVSLPKMVMDEMDTYYDNMKIVLPTLGYNILAINNTTSDSESASLSKSLVLEIGKCKASARLTSNGIMVLSGSTMNAKEWDSFSGSYSNLRKTLLEKKIIEGRNDMYVFIDDYEFSSPSTAAAIVLGYSINGRTAWKDRSGRTLNEMEQAQLSSAE